METAFGTHRMLSPSTGTMKFLGVPFKHSKKLAALNENVTLIPVEIMGHTCLLADAEHVAQIMKFASGENNKP